MRNATVPLLVMLLLLSSCSRPTTPGGSKMPQEKGPDPKLVYPAANAVWIAGDRGIWKSTDQADTWTQQYETQYNMGFLQFTDDQHGWAVEEISWPHQRLIGTADGGDTWNVIAELPDGVRNLKFLGSATGYATRLGGKSGETLIRSTDGGRTWESVNTPQGVQESCFSTPEAGWIVGTDDELLYTSDGGATWSSFGPIPWFVWTGDGVMREGITVFTLGSVPDPAVVFTPKEDMQTVCGPDSTLFLLAYYGRGAGTANWALYKVTPSTGWTSIADNFTEPSALTKGGLVAAPDADHVFMVGSGSDWVGIGGTLGGGMDWQTGFIDGKTFMRTDERTDTTLAGFPSDVHFTTPTTGWMAVYDWTTKGHLLLLTTDGGNTWEIKASS